MSLLVAKVGGSLFDLPDLRDRLRTWLATQSADSILLVPGGGATTNVIRNLHRIHGLNEEQSHYLALHSLELNARFLSTLLDNLPIVKSPDEDWKGKAILNAFEFCTYDVAEDRLPEHWNATSDSIAARAAIVFEASELILLKSVDVSPDLSWEQAAKEELVDPLFPALAAQLRKVNVVNLRAMTMT